MKHTRVATLLVLAALGGVVGSFLEMGLAAGGMPIVIPPITLPIALAVIGGIIVTLAVPIRRTTKGDTRSAVDPFYATKVLVLAKASSMSGALMTGFGIGMLSYLLTRSVIGVGSVAQVIATIVGAAVLLAAGLIAERMCRVPPGDDDDDDDGKLPIRAQP